MRTTPQNPSIQDELSTLRSTIDGYERQLDVLRQKLVAGMDPTQVLNAVYKCIRLHQRRDKAVAKLNVFAKKNSIPPKIELIVKP